eukprot:TRINITY_DN52919_c0_g1_i1.p1 TRINITY_DN52919_c0_g1~~TRINITY_DN52919_c0_g1_i1.p1  ORF type:complete len:1050 (+),score=81.60 TRINITY_DN52919_c0_g1_i1:58-3150(+)
MPATSVAAAVLAEAMRTSNLPSKPEPRSTSSPFIRTLQQLSHQIPQIQNWVSRLQTVHSCNDFLLLRDPHTAKCYAVAAFHSTIQDIVGPTFQAKNLSHSTQEAASAPIRNFISWLRQCAQQYPNDRIYAIGSSFGGAVCIVAAIFLKQAYNLTIEVDAYNPTGLDNSQSLKQHADFNTIRCHYLMPNPTSSTHLSSHSQLPTPDLVAPGPVDLITPQSTSIPDDSLLQFVCVHKDRPGNCDPWTWVEWSAQQQAQWEASQRCSAPRFQEFVNSQTGARSWEQQPQRGLVRAEDVPLGGVPLPRGVAPLHGAMFNLHTGDVVLQFGQGNLPPCPTREWEEVVFTLFHAHREPYFSLDPVDVQQLGAVSETLERSLEGASARLQNKQAVIECTKRDVEKQENHVKVLKQKLEAHEQWATKEMETLRSGTYYTQEEVNAANSKIKEIQNAYNEEVKAYNVQVDVSKRTIETHNQLIHEHNNLVTNQKSILSIESLRPQLEKLYQKKVYGPEALENTLTGYLMWKADWLLKQLSQGHIWDDEKQCISCLLDESNVLPGYRSLPKLYQEMGVRETKGMGLHRMWLVCREASICPKETTFGINLTVTNIVMGCEARGMQIHEGKLQDVLTPESHPASRFARWVSTNWQQLANKFPEFQALERVTVLIALAKWLHNTAHLPPEALVSVHRRYACCSPVGDDYPYQQVPTLVNTTRHQASEGEPTVIVYGGVDLQVPVKEVAPPKRVSDKRPASPSASRVRGGYQANVNATSSPYISSFACTNSKITSKYDSKANAALLRGNIVTEKEDDVDEVESICELVKALPSIQDVLHELHTPHKPEMQATTITSINMDLPNHKKSKTTNDMEIHSANQNRSTVPRHTNASSPTHTSSSTRHLGAPSVLKEKKMNSCVHNSNVAHHLEKFQQSGKNLKYVPGLRLSCAECGTTVPLDKIGGIKNVRYWCHNKQGVFCSDHHPRACGLKGQCKEGQIVTGEKTGGMITLVDGVAYHPECLEIHEHQQQEEWNKKYRHPEGRAAW